MTAIWDRILCTDHKTSKSQGISFLDQFFYPQQQLIVNNNHILVPHSHLVETENF